MNNNRNLAHLPHEKEQQPDEIKADIPEGIISREELLARVHHYEEMFGMSSEDFLKRWEADTVPDTFETNSWAMLLHALSFE